MLIFMQFHHGEWSAENLFIFPENVTHPIVGRLRTNLAANKSKMKYNTHTVQYIVTSYSYHKNIMDPPGVFIVFYTFYMFFIHIHRYR